MKIIFPCVKIYTWMTPPPPDVFMGDWDVHYLRHEISIHEHIWVTFSFSCMERLFSCMKVKCSCHDLFMHDFFSTRLPLIYTTNP